MQRQLKDVYTDWLSGTDGVFYYLQNLSGVNVPWKALNISESLDLEYHGNTSGEKLISPLVKAMLNSSGELSAQAKNKLAAAMWAMYKTKWTRLYALLSIEYNPIENYSMTEKHTGTETALKTPTDWKSTQTQTPTDWKTTETQKPTDWKSTQTQTPNEWKTTETQTPTEWKSTETQTPTDWTETRTETPTDWTETQSQSGDNNKVVTESEVYGFNSVSGVDDRKTTVTTDSSTATTRTGTYETETSRTGTYATETAQSGTYETEQEQTGTYETETEQSGTYETETEQSGTFETETEQTGTFEDKMTYNTTLERSGNIGVTTSQQMAESEIALWQWEYFRGVFADVDKMLCLSVY